MKYLLTFKPLKHFFFGNNKTFSDDYLAVSEYFPQNTQLLGALRLFIAEQQGLMKVYKKGKWCSRPEELKALTGTATSKDFMVNSDLGKIKNLSQMFIVSKELDDAYFPTPFDVKIEFDKTTVLLTHYKLENIDEQYFLANYDVKNRSDQMLGNKNFWHSYLKQESKVANALKLYNDVFVEHTQVGIELDNKQTVDKKFYSKTDYQLDKKFLFGCVVDFEEKIIDDGIIQIGAESSLFELKVHSLDDTVLTEHPIVSRLFETPQDGNKLICMSDTILNTTDDFNAYFSIIPFAKDFAMLDKTKTKFNGKTRQKRVIPTGTVSFVKDGKVPESSIGAYAKMGYNQYITVNN